MSTPHIDAPTDAPTPLTTKVQAPMIDFDLEPNNLKPSDKPGFEVYHQTPAGKFELVTVIYGTSMQNLTRYFGSASTYTPIPKSSAIEIRHALNPGRAFLAVRVGESEVPAGP